jgi:zinc D-Ala-D-Ala carboxypeptidase
MSTFKHESDHFGVIDLGTMIGVQTALTAMALDCGDVDGFDGPKTQAAVRVFQEQAMIGVDGIVGDETRGAMLVALNNLAAAAAEQNQST